MGSAWFATLQPKDVGRASEGQWADGHGGGQNRIGRLRGEEGCSIDWWRCAAERVSCSSLFRSLQTGMRGAFGKTYGTVARVEIGQILLSVRARDVHKPQVMEALRRAKYKFPGRQRLCYSENWGFTKLKRDRYEELKKEGRLVKDGINVKVLPTRGKLDSYTLSKLPLTMLQPADAADEE